jgi:hypothetical protein
MGALLITHHLVAECDNTLNNHFEWLGMARVAIQGATSFLPKVWILPRGRIPGPRESKESKPGRTI